jgi:hypothetical protein
VAKQVRIKTNKPSKLKPLPTTIAPQSMKALVLPGPLISVPAVGEGGGSTPAMFGHPSAPDLSQCVPPPPTAVGPPLGADDASSLVYWKARAEFVAQKIEYYERKCGDLGMQLGFATHALNDHMRKSKMELESVNDSLALALDENVRLSSLLAAALEKQKDYDSLVEDKRLMQSVMDSMTETLNLYVQDPLPGFGHTVMSSFPCDGCCF